MDVTVEGDLRKYWVGLHTLEPRLPHNAVKYDAPLRPDQLTRIHKLDDQTYYLAFAPLEFAPIFESLEHTFYTLPILSKEHNGRVWYYLKEDVAKDWTYLEGVILKVTRQIGDRCKVTRPLQHDGSKDMTPSMYPFWKFQTNEYNVRKTAYKSLLAFTAQLSRLSYYFFDACYRNLDPFEIIATVEDPVPAIVLNKIKGSWVCNPQTPRVGVIVDSLQLGSHTDDMQWQTSIWTFLSLPHLPVWICYHDGNVQPPQLVWQLWLPRADHIAAINQARHPPAPKSLSIHEWLESRAEQRQRRLANETPEQKTARESREKAHEGQPIPGQRGARVFEWDFDQTTGIWTREAIPRSDRQKLEMLWETTTPHGPCLIHQPGAAPSVCHAYSVGMGQASGQYIKQLASAAKRRLGIAAACQIETVALPEGISCLQSKVTARFR